MNHKPKALITGASSGIGAAFARDLAERGYDLILVARRADRLKDLADQLKEQHGTASTIAPVDLNLPNMPRKLAEALKARGQYVEMLVNNAGYSLPGHLLDQDWEQHRDFLQIMVNAPIELSWHLLPTMLERGRGNIINVASVAGLIPGTAGHTLYSAAKAFMIKFSQSLALEYRDQGIHTCAVCPGFTWSEFHDVNGSRALMNKMPKWMWLDSDRVAREGIDAVLKGKVVQVSGLQYKAIHAITKLLPERLLLRMIARRSAQFRVQSA
ncbi:MAG: SDR family oxidoreductase [Xanthomonadales bacterium]|nr:SDR family oxidoreductase [Xanthomonadales bacterium]